MRKLPLAIAGGLLLLFGLAATPAYANCAEKIKAAEQRLASAPADGRAKAKVHNVQKNIDEAKKALEEGKMKKCEKRMELVDKDLANFGR
jgi:hypothetical protein